MSTTAKLLKFNDENKTESNPLVCLCSVMTCLKDDNNHNEQN